MRGRRAQAGVAVLLVLLALAGCQASSGAKPDGSAVVETVIDGDSLRLDDGREVRLVQVDAPEGSEGECFAERSRAMLAELAPPGTELRLEADPALDSVDQYERLLRYVFRGEDNVNLVLVRSGAATPYFFRGDRGRYADLLLESARNARAAGRGLWGACPGTPLEPGRGADTGSGGEPESEAAAEPASCDGAIPWTEAATHEGERVTVEGPVAGARYVPDVGGSPTFLNVGRDHPDPDRFTVIVWGDDRGRFPEPPEEAYAGRTICVTGEIELYQGVAEIDVDDPSQIVLSPSAP